MWVELKYTYSHMHMHACMHTAFLFVFSPCSEQVGTDSRHSDWGTTQCYYRSSHRGNHCLCSPMAEK